MQVLRQQASQPGHVEGSRHPQWLRTGAATASRGSAGPGCRLSEPTRRRFDAASSIAVRGGDQVRILSPLSRSSGRACSPSGCRPSCRTSRSTKPRTHPRCSSADPIRVQSSAAATTPSSRRLGRSATTSPFPSAQGVYVHVHAATAREHPDDDTPSGTRRRPPRRNPPRSAPGTQRPRQIGDSGSHPRRALVAGFAPRQTLIVP